jgi:hypothetical protein
MTNNRRSSKALIDQGAKTANCARTYKPPYTGAITINVKALFAFFLLTPIHYFSNQRQHQTTTNNRTIEPNHDQHAASVKK